jgi:hypothetical protein
MDRSKSIGKWTDNQLYDQYRFYRRELKDLAEYLSPDLKFDNDYRADVASPMKQVSKNTYINFCKAYIVYFSYSSP